MEIAADDSITIVSTIDGNQDSGLTFDSHTYLAKQSIKLRCYGTDKFQLTVNGKKITPPEPKARESFVEFEINKNNIAQILQSGKIIIGEATKSSSTPNNPATLKNSIGMEFVKIPAGSFMMGSDNGESNEKPVHKVTISNDFYLGKYEVTQPQWKAIMGNNPSRFQGDNLPVENVSWNDAQEFIKKLNAKDEGTYRLPTEAEWEYPERAGTTGDYYGDLDSIGWYDKNSGVKTHEVGTKQPNAWGLFDMSGNAGEWCSDWYGAVYASESVSDPTGATSGSMRVLRGGGFFSIAGNLRSAYRDGFPPSVRAGFRLLRTK